MENGRTLSGLDPSTYELVLKDYFDSGYPLGAFMPLGVGGALTGVDIAWLFQPTIAFCGAILALSIYSLTSALVSSRALRAAAAFLGAQPDLLFAYALWSGIKEVAAAAIIALVVALVAATIERWSSWRALLPGHRRAALVADESCFGAAWLITPALVAGGVAPADPCGAAIEVASRCSCAFSPCRRSHRADVLSGEHPGSVTSDTRSPTSATRWTGCSSSASGPLRTSETGRISGSRGC
jgi:hypothetical protein